MFDTKAILKQCGIQPVQSGTCGHQLGWGPTAGRPAFDAICPADGKLSAQIVGSNAAEYQSIIDASVSVQKSWAMVPAPRRGELVRRIGELVQANMEALAA